MKLPFHKGIILVFLAALLPACTTLPAPVAEDPARVKLYQQKSARLGAVNSWSLAGRLAVSDSEDGGSGSFQWKKGVSDSRMDFHGAMGRGAWRLLANSDGAVLELADGTAHHADSIDELVRSQVGWEIPVRSLSWWVRGLSAPGEYSSRQLDVDGNLRQLEQGGWEVEFGKYRSVQGVSLPVKITARQEEWKVKLVIRQWGLADESASSE